MRSGPVDRTPHPPDVGGDERVTRAARARGGHRPRRAFGLSGALLAKAAITIALLGTTAALEQCRGRLVIPGIGSIEGEWSDTDVTIIDVPSHYERCGEGRDDKTGRTYCVWCDPNDPFHVYHDWDCDRRRGEIWRFDPARSHLGAPVGGIDPSVTLIGSLDDPRTALATIVLDRELEVPADAFRAIELVAPGARVALRDDVETLVFAPGIPMVLAGSVYDLLDVAYLAGLHRVETSLGGSRAEIRTAPVGGVIELLVDGEVAVTRVVGAGSD